MQAKQTFDTSKHTCLDCVHSGTLECFECHNRNKFETTPEIGAMSYKEKCERYEKQSNKSIDDKIEEISKIIYKIGFLHGSGKGSNRSIDPFIKKLNLIFRERRSGKLYE